MERRIRWAAAGAGLVMVAVLMSPALAAQPSEQPITVPAIGSSAQVTWTGTIPQGSNASSDCTAQPSALADIESLKISVPGSLYNSAVSTFTFTIKWNPSTGDENTNDEILSVVDPKGNEVGSSDGGNPSETFTASNLGAGTYQVEACGFANAAPQDYNGSLTVVSKAKGGGPRPPAQTGPRVSFGVPRVVDPIHSFGEPSIRVGPSLGGKQGSVVVSGPAGTGTQRSVWDISRDNGNSWRVVQDVPSGGAPAEVPAKETDGPGGGDTELAIAHNGTIYYADLYDLRCFTTAVTPDNGKTVQSSANGCSGNFAADRQWYALFDPLASDHTTSPYHGDKPLLYLSFNDITTGAHVSMSTDGLNFTDAGEYGDGAGKYHWSVADSPIVVDQRTGDLLAAVVGDGNRMGLAVGKPQSDGTLKFSYQEVTGPRAGDESTLFPVIAQDTARNLYITWVEGCGTSGSGPKISDPECFHVFYAAAHASAGWGDWSKPLRVDAPPSRTAVMPWVAAGKSGIIDIVWYGSHKRENPSTVDSKHPRAWNTYMAQIRHAASAHPRFRQSAASRHPTHYNSICLLGTGCITAQGDRNLADFFEVTIDNHGRARIVYCDTSNGLIQQGFQPSNGLSDHKGAEVVTVATQNQGVNNWTGKRLKPFEKTRPRAEITDRKKDALVNKPLGGTPSKGADIRDVRLAFHKKHWRRRFVIRVRTSGESLATAASDAGAAFGQLVVRWQLGRTLYYGEVEQDAGGASTSFYAGKVQSIDLCSVSACDPHYFVYPGPPNGGNTVSGKVIDLKSKGTKYVIRIPAKYIGKQKMKRWSLLQEVAAYVFAAPQSATQPVTTSQAEAEQGIPIEIEGTKTFNFRAKPRPRAR